MQKRFLFLTSELKLLIIPHGMQSPITLNLYYINRKPYIIQLPDDREDKLFKIKVWYRKDREKKSYVKSCEEAYSGLGANKRQELPLVPFVSWASSWTMKVNPFLKKSPFQPYTIIVFNHSIVLFFFLKKVGMLTG